ncbi:MAG: hypothetical protein KC410_19765 [Anaerolineales bacterium]|nr:hypothetical protein [Anaerolineales bacterium]
MSQTMELPEDVYPADVQAEIEARSIVREYVNDTGQMMRMRVTAADEEALAGFLQELTLAFGIVEGDETGAQEVPDGAPSEPYLDGLPDLEVRFEFPGIEPPFRWGVAVDPTLWGFRSHVYVGPYTNITATITHLGNETAMFLPTGQVNANAANQFGQLSGWTTWVVVRGQTEGPNAYNIYIQGATFR